MSSTQRRWSSAAFVPFLAIASLLVLAPAGGAAPSGEGWSRPVRVSAGPLYSVSCASERFCVAVGANGAIVTFDGSTWRERAPLPGVDRLWSVDCPTVRRCVAVGDRGVVTFFDGSAWSKPVDDDPGRTLSAVACWRPTDCLVGDSSSLVFTLRGTTASRPKFVDTYATYFTAYTAMSCAPQPAELCAAVDSSGSLLVWQRGTWTSTRLATDPPVVSILASDIVSSVACVAATDCVAVTNAGGIVLWNGRSWSVPKQFDPHGLVAAAIACPSEGRCLLLDDAGDAYTVTPTSGSVSAPIATGLAESLPVAISCPTTGFCAAVTGGGMATTYRGGTLRA